MLPDFIFANSKSVAVSRSVEEAIAVQKKYSRFGFNTFSASLDHCISLAYRRDVPQEDLSGVENIPRYSQNLKTADSFADYRKERLITEFNSATLNDLSAIFEDLSQYDLVFGLLNRTCGGFLSTYERRV